jgi:hypothetical protein
VAEVVDAMRLRLEQPPGQAAQHRFFLETYLRTTEAVGAAVDSGSFEDPAWVQRWDVVFAQFYLDALDAHLRGNRTGVARPWRLAFDAPADLPALRHVLLGINAHVNYDLPQALLAMIDESDFTDPVLLARRRRDHERIDAVLAQRVGGEDAELAAGRSLVDKLLTPLNQRASVHFLREARQKVWHNAAELHVARLAGGDQLRLRTAELEVLSAARIADLLEPGQVLLRLAVAGFGVTLPPA